MIRYTAPCPLVSACSVKNPAASQRSRRPAAVQIGDERARAQTASTGSSSGASGRTGRTGPARRRRRSRRRARPRTPARCGAPSTKAPRPQSTNDTSETAFIASTGLPVAQSTGAGDHHASDEVLGERQGALVGIEDVGVENRRMAGWPGRGRPRPGSTCRCGRRGHCPERSSRGAPKSDRSAPRSGRPGPAAPTSRPPKPRVSPARTPRPALPAQPLPPGPNSVLTARLFLRQTLLSERNRAKRHGPRPHGRRHGLRRRQRSVSLARGAPLALRVQRGLPADRHASRTPKTSCRTRFSRPIDS